MLTGTGLSETRTATFDQFNLDLTVWIKQATSTKQRLIHRVSNSREATALIRSRCDPVPNGPSFSK
jgi:hypothetical protein